MFQRTLSLIIIFLSFSALSKEQSSVLVPEKPVAREKIIGNIIKSTLENYHFRKVEVNNDVSKKAFGEFLKKFDYGKQFFYQKDVDNLKKYEFKIDDQLASADYKLLNLSIKTLNQRIDEAEAFRKKVFKKQFDFNKKEEFELDPEKRSWAITKKDWQEYWRKNFKQAVLMKYMTYIEEQNEDDEKEDKDKKDKKKEKPEKKLSDKEMRKKAHEKVSEKYEKFFARLKQEDRNDYLEKFYNSVTTIFDPHTSYLPPKRKEDFDIDISGQLEGIGAVLQEDGSYIKVVRIVPGGAAWRQKDLQTDDVILSVKNKDSEAVDLVDMRVEDAVRHIRGKKGTTVVLNVKRADGTRKSIPIVRDVVELEASYAKSSVLQYDDLPIKIGYIHLPKFYRDFGDGDKRNCTKDVRAELIRLKKEKVDGVVLDLRNNTGGALEDARTMSGLFIPKGPVVQVKSLSGRKEVLADRDPSVEYDGPLVVLTNRLSASASEILAGAMQDYKRAVIVGGEYSHGKGTVQAVMDLNGRGFGILSSPDDNYGAMKVTIQKFYRINGDSTQYKGVTPDIVLPDPLAYAENREQDLDFSLPWDRVKTREFKFWDRFFYDVNSLKSKSKKRVSKNDHFEKIKKSVAYLKDRKEKTRVSLNLKEVMKEEEENKKVTEKLKLDFLDTKLKVTNVEASLLSHEKVRKEDKKQWKKDFEKRKKDWVENLQKDPTIIESMHIVNDMITEHQKRLTMAEKKK